MIIHHEDVGFNLGIQDRFNICKSIHVILHINIIKEKSHIILSIDAEKTFDKKSLPVCDKSAQQIKN